MGSNQTHHARHTFGAVTLAAVLGLTACSAGGDDADTAAGADAESTAEEAFDDGTFDDATFDEGAFDEGASTEDVGGVDAEAPADAGFDLGIIGRDVIIEMSVVVSSDDIQRTVGSITTTAASLGGGVASSNVDFGSATDPSRTGYATLVVRVPPESVDRLLAGLDDTGVVQSINQSAQDVTEQLVDLDVRIDNARQSVVNVREFMERTENLNELVTLEAELTRRQTDLERLEAQQRNVSDRVALSTITIEVVPTAAVPEPVDEGDDSIGDAFRSGWGAFVGFLFAIGFVFAAVLPFLVTMLLLAVVAWLLVRRRDRARTIEHAVGGGRDGSADPRPVEPPTPEGSDERPSDEHAPSPS